MWQYDVATASTRIGIEQKSGTVHGRSAKEAAPSFISNWSKRVEQTEWIS